MGAGAQATGDGGEVAPRRVGGRLRLVGAGPGDPDLLTLAAYRSIKEADLVLADRLIPQAIIDMIAGEVKVANKVPGRADPAQCELNELGLEAVKRGLDVVRLKGGDPFMFGRGGEEILFFREHGIEPEVIPGVSSSLCAPLAANIPVTHRGVADQLLITTGRGQNGSIPDIPPYAPSRTTVFLMAVGRLPALAAELPAIGYPLTVPVAIVEKATRADTQRVVVGTLADIAQKAKAAEVKAPATIVIGHVVHTLNPRTEEPSSGGSAAATAALAAKLAGSTALPVDARLEVGDSSGAGPLLQTIGLAMGSRAVAAGGLMA